MIFECDELVEVYDFTVGRQDFDFHSVYVDCVLIASELVSLETGQDLRLRSVL